MSATPTGTPPPARRRALGAFGAAAIALPLALTPVAANAAPADPAPAPVPRGAISAITSGTYLPGYAAEFAAQVDDATVFEHVRHLAVDIGPRVAGTAAEVRANAYVQDLLNSYGFSTEIEKFPVSESLFANATPSRDAGLQVSWQFRPASNALFTGPDAPVTAEVVDVGAGEGFDPAAVAGKFVLLNWNATAAARNAKIVELAEAGAAGVIVAQTTQNSSLAAVGNVSAAATGIQVVGAADGQAQRIRELLAGGPLSLALTTEKSSLESSNTIGVRPAQGENAENAPIVYIGAHIDSVVGSPGASDNGSGVGILLESARIMSQYPLNTEIRVGTWGAEEKGIVGSKTHATQLSPDEIDRTIGAWNMDMAGTSFLGTAEQPFEFWGLTVNKDNEDNAVLKQASALSNITGRGDLNRGVVGRSDHQSFHDVGIDAAVFSWMFWSATSSIVLEPTYHKPSDTIDNISQERIGIAAELIGGSAFRAALNPVAVTVADTEKKPQADVPVAMSCGEDDGWREVGRTDEAGTVEALAPALECDFAALAADGSRGAVLDQQVTGAGTVQIGLAHDTAAPSIEFAAPEGENAAGWYRSGPVQLTLSATDAGDTAPTVEFSVNGGEWQPYTAPIEVGAEGETVVSVRATDASGNVAEDSRSIRIDTGAPVLTATPSASTRGEVTVSATDATSGVAGVEYRVLPSGEWQEAPLPAALRRSADPMPIETTVVVPLGDAAGSVEFRATDVAGNPSELVTLEFAAAKPGETKPPVTPTKPGTKPVAKPDDALAATGGNNLLLIGAATGALLLVAGGAIMVARRREAASE
ncbi:M28 family peptidase [Leucobacter chromiireducens]|uniref:M28 family peptidase n=1 Tax=Leucobacter chromiireducens subsp. chromiireducens TaxID=660067 RepID=A0ABS1SR49_9MICO|nr:M28 family peptidase [Leucobacter chromiireducens]MBL3690474.1 M28 family peptidase [Leucobacter chromiireducens subsp. chromiireducens]